MIPFIRERPSTRLAALVDAPGGPSFRWGGDGKPDDALHTLTFSTTMPGGFEMANVTLARKPELAYNDLQEFSTLGIYGLGEVAWEGRLEGSPRQSGDTETIQPHCVGWQAHLEDDSAARMIFVDIDRTQWLDASTHRQLDLIAAGWKFEGASVSQDWTAGQPSLLTRISQSASKADSEAWYDAQGIPIGKVYYAWTKESTIDYTTVPPNSGGLAASGPQAWYWLVDLVDDDRFLGGFDETLIQSAGPGSGLRVATGSHRRWARLALTLQEPTYPTTPPSSIPPNGVQWTIYWNCLAVYGNHNLPLQGVGTQSVAPGLLGSDIVAFCIGRWAPKLAFSQGPDGTIQPSDFPIPHLSQLDPTTASDLIKQVSVFDLYDWAVWEGPTFFWNARGARGNKWRTRVGPAKLQDTGPNVQRLFNGVTVQFTDVLGINRSAGPPGSGCSVEDPVLFDPDPENPVTQAGLQRYGAVQMGTSVNDAAIRVGQAFLQEQKLVDKSGEAQLIGHVEDDKGVLWPAWKVRAGDEIAFVDAADSSYRRVVRTDYDDKTKINSVSLDAPPDAMQSLLARLNAVLMPYGIG